MFTIFAPRFRPRLQCTALNPWHGQNPQLVNLLAKLFHVDDDWRKPSHFRCKDGTLKGASLENKGKTQTTTKRFVFRASFCIRRLPDATTV